MSLAKFAILFLLLAVSYSSIKSQGIPPGPSIKNYEDFKTKANAEKPAADLFTAITLETLKAIVSDAAFVSTDFKTAIDNLSKANIILTGAKFSEKDLSEFALIDRIIISCIDVLPVEFIKAISKKSLDKLTLKDAQVDAAAIKAFFASKKLTSDLIKEILSTKVDDQQKLAFLKSAPIQTLLDNLAILMPHLDAFDTTIKALDKTGYENVLTHIANTTDKQQALEFACHLVGKVTLNQFKDIISLTNDTLKVGKELLVSCIKKSDLKRIYGNDFHAALIEHGTLFAHAWKYLTMKDMKELVKIDDTNFTVKAIDSLTTIKAKLATTMDAVGSSSSLYSDKITKEAIDVEIKKINDAIANGTPTVEQTRQLNFYKALSDAIVRPTCATCATCPANSTCKGDAVAITSSYAALVAGLGSAILVFV